VPDESAIATLREFAEAVQIRGAQVEALLTGDDLVPLDETRASQEPVPCGDLRETLLHARELLGDAEELARKLRRVMVTPLSREELRAAGQWPLPA
jgi:hypothetical protein